MDYNKILSDYAKEHNWEFINNHYQIAENLSVKSAKDGIRFTDERVIKREIPFEENPYEDKSGGLFYSVETEEVYTDLDSVVNFILIGNYS